MEDKAWIRQRAYRVIVVEHQENRVEEGVTKFIFVITATTSTSKTSELPCIAVVRREALVFKARIIRDWSPDNPAPSSGAIYTASRSHDPGRPRGAQAERPARQGSSGQSEWQVKVVDLLQVQQHGHYSNQTTRLER